MQFFNGLLSTIQTAMSESPDTLLKKTQLFEQKEEALPPWEDFEAPPEVRAEVRKKILELGSSRTDLMTGPPSDVNFAFNLDTHIDSAKAAVKQDSKLSKLRFELVPRRIEEEKFWRNYFYRIYLIKKAFGLTVTNISHVQPQPSSQIQSEKPHSQLNDQSSQSQNQSSQKLEKLHLETQAPSQKQRPQSEKQQPQSEKQQPQSEKLLPQKSQPETQSENLQTQSENLQLGQSSNQETKSVLEHPVISFQNSFDDPLHPDFDISLHLEDEFATDDLHDGPTNLEHPEKTHFDVSKFEEELRKELEEN